MKTKTSWSQLMVVVLIGALLTYTQSASSNSSNQRFTVPRAVPNTVHLLMPLTTTLDVDRTDDTAAATACTPAPNDCSLRGAIIAANTNVSADPVVINLQAATTYNLTLANATQENAAATGDLDITTVLHTVTIVGGGSSTIIDAAGLTSGNMRDRAFQITGSGVTAIFENLTIQNGRAGRVYTITFSVTDAEGNVGTATAKVTVPKAQNGPSAVDDGAEYTVLCGSP